MKKLVALLVSAAMILTLAASAFAAPSEVTWADYQQYLIDTAGSNAPDLQEFTDQVMAISSWEELDQTVSPWDQMFTTIGLSTWEEFQAGDVKEAAVPAGENMGGSGDSADDAASEGGESEDAQAAEGESAEIEAISDEAAAALADGIIAALEETMESTADMKVSSYSTNNSNTSRAQDEGHIYIGYSFVNDELAAEESNWETDSYTDSYAIELNNIVDGEGFTAVRADSSFIKVTGNLIMGDDSDGQVASDFSGVGAAISASNKSYVEVDGVTYESVGFGRSFAIVEDSVMTINNSTIVTMGANPFTDSWDGYFNSANTSIMLSPPWVLGIQGGIRAINVLGTGSTFVLADSTVTSSGWAAVSTDGCTNPYLYLVNSTLEILPESEGGMTSGWAILGYDEDDYGTGYGTYIIGGAQEYFYGMTITGATYGSILTGGDGYYAGLEAGQIYDFTAEAGGSVGTYEAHEDVPTVINTVFGFMAHNSGSINVLAGTVVNTANATALYKSADSVWNFDGAELNPENGVIFQMIDNDDSTVGGFNPFGTYLYEEAGFPTEAYADASTYVFTTDTAVDPAKTYYTSDTEDGTGFAVVENPTDEGTVAYYELATGGNTAEVNFANGEYEGDIYNATGYYNQAPDALVVNIADSASLTGDIALTSHIHGVMLGERTVEEVEAAIAEQNASHAEVGGYYADTEDIQYVYIDAEGNVTEDAAEAIAIQFTQFSTLEYFLMGQVLNLYNYNGMSTIDVYVEGTWAPTEEALVTYLNVAEGAEVYGELTELEDGSIMIIPSEELIPAGEYGKAYIAAEAPAEESEGGESAGESAEEGASEDAEAEGASEEAPAEGESAEEAAPAEAAAGDKWAAYIQYLKDTLEIDPSFDLYSQIKGELETVTEADYTGMEDGTLFGAMQHSYGVVSYEDYEIGMAIPDVTSAVGLDG